MNSRFVVVTLGLFVAAAQAGVIDHWAFDEGSGTTAVDSVSGRNGTLSGSVAWTNLGRNGTTALAFTGGQVDLPGSVYGAVNGTQAMTMTMWINMANYTGYETIFGDQGRQFSLWLNAGGGWHGTDGFGGVLNFTPPLPLNSWHFLTVAYKTGPTSDYDLYIDNVRAGGFQPSTGTRPFSDPSQIGGTLSGGQVFTGMIQDVTFYDHAMTQSEVEGSGVPEPGTLALLGLGIAAIAASHVRRKA